MEIENEALYKVGYGLYVISVKDGDRDCGMICNTVMQVTAEPARVAVAIHKGNYTHDVAKRTGVMNVNILSESAKFALFENFGFRSSRDADKFADVSFTRSANGLAVLSEDCNAYLALKVEQYVDLGTHGMFICAVEEAKALSSAPTMTYAYYHAYVKPKPKVEEQKKGFVCPICGYVYEGDELPPDFICPWCKHPASEFVKL